MYRRFSDIECKLWCGVMWSPSHYVGTTGHVYAETVERYVKDQHTECGSSSSTG
jgi:REP element-mobilizing transposase RayT